MSPCLLVSLSPFSLSPSLCVSMSLWLRARYVVLRYP
jgi:hypothetical protein